MSEVARLYRYKSLLSVRGAVPTATLMAELEISPATLKRNIAKLRDQLHVPIVFDRDLLKSFQSVAAGTLARKHLRTRVRKSLPEAAGHYV